ncbi:MAG: mannose-1-phosphate guanylyltransferase [Candidatus Dadabacteria bacterium]|nr:MAG: mannose-1-phosphate guanylyltransferase [Candidatus Dadabacteria bacterium]
MNVREGELVATDASVDIKIVIMAGGHGSRFWPVSRMNYPKQFLSIREDGESLIAATARRNRPLCGDGNVWIVTNVLHEGLVKEHVPDAHILTEPVARNTAAAAGLAAVHIARENPDAVMILLPADHAVRDEQGLRDTLSEAVNVALSGDLLVTVGIEPTFAHTGYGYIKRGEKLEAGGFSVAGFFEKPNLKKAEEYLQAGDYYWNSGMFIWRASVFLNAIKEFLPGHYSKLMRIADSLEGDSSGQVIEEEFSGFEPVSIDVGIMEKAQNRAIVLAKDFGWSDVGSWDVWADHFQSDQNGNVIYGEGLCIDSENCVVHSPGRFTALLGCKDLIVIESDDAIMVCPRDRVQEVKKIVEQLRAENKKNLL